jgi:hypothetical protein
MKSWVARLVSLPVTVSCDVVATTQPDAPAEHFEVPYGGTD